MKARLMSKHLAEFYKTLALPSAQFGPQVKKEFLAKIKKWKVLGGASKTERKKDVAEAINALEVYKGMPGITDGAQKITTFKKIVGELWKGEPIPAPSGVSTIQTSMKRTEALYNIIMAKFALLDYWEGVATGKTEPEYPEDGTLWRLHEFLQFEPTKVRPVLEMMLQDAANLLTKPWSATLEPWCGATASHSFSYTKESIGRTIKAEATAKVGAQVEGKFEVEYKKLKLVANAEAFAGAKAKASGKIVQTATSVNAKGEVEVEIGVRIKADVNVNIGDALELSAEGEAFAGALANASAEIFVSASGVKIDLSAEAFAGARIKGEASGKLSLGGREIMTAKAKGSLTAGAGASAELNFECSVFGKVSFGAAAEATLGLGAGGGAKFSVDFHNVKWGMANLFWAYVNEKGFKNQGKVWLLPVDENAKMCVKARDILFKQLGELYQKNEDSLAALDAWKVLENKIATSVKSKNPRLRALTI